jgi:hypothetical protein
MPDERRTETRVVSESEARQERERQAAREATERDPDAKPMTETEPGGHYIRDDGVHINANGEPLKGQ